MMNLFFILSCLILTSQPLKAKVEKSNYDFSLESLAVFNPESSVTDMVTKYGKAELINSPDGTPVNKFMVAQIRYKFPVLVQIREEKSVDFFAKLPSYFLHDVFFQSLVNKLGKQSKYKRVGEEAYYIWEKDNLRHVYSAACTITCFPIFYSVSLLNVPPEKSFTSILDQMKKAFK